MPSGLEGLLEVLVSLKEISAIFLSYIRCFDRVESWIQTGLGVKELNAVRGTELRATAERRRRLVTESELAERESEDFQGIAAMKCGRGEA